MFTNEVLFLWHHPYIVGRLGCALLFRVADCFENAVNGNKVLGFSTAGYCCARLCGFEIQVFPHSVVEGGGLLGCYSMLLGECLMTLQGLLCLQNVRYHTNSDTSSHPRRLNFFLVGGGLQQGFNSATFFLLLLFITTCPITW